MKNILYIKILFLLFVITPSVSQELNNSSINLPENILKFADYLYGEKEYSRSVIEYQRYLFLTKLSVDSISFRIGLCYLYLGQLDKASEKFDTFLNEGCENNYFSEALFYEGYKDFEVNDYAKSTSLIEKYGSENSICISNNDKINFLITSNSLSIKDWQKSENALNKISISGNFASNKEYFRDLLFEGQNLNEKNPYLSAGLSTVIPGLGKVYAGKPIDGLFSFLLLGFTTWQAYEGFAEDKMESVKGWLFTGIGTVFYIGNIYGSYVSVKIYNEEINHEYINKIHIELRKVINN